MTRLLVHVEGQTEESFVNEVLRNHLLSVGYQLVSARIVGNARLRQRRGGIRSWPTVRKDIINHLRQDAGCVATTMVDFYAMPQQGDGAWPGRASATGIGSALKASCVETALAADLSNAVGPDFNPNRFVPFVVMHEFEGLLFSDCKAFCQGIGRQDLESKFQQIRNEFNTPEDINDSPITCPSMRVKNLVPGYEKPLYGTLAALEVGLSRIRGQCPHFDDWLRQLGSLVNLSI
jgi:hypothetical protein